MLTRAARQRQNLRQFQHEAHRLQLPWLCPALYTSFTSVATPARPPIASGDSSRRSIRRAPLSTHSPKHASASPVPDILQSTPLHKVFPYPQNVSGLSQPQMPSLSSDLDFSKLLMIDQTTAIPPPRTDSLGSKSFDIRGSSQDLEANLEACLHVANWDRALTVLRQLMVLCDPSSKEAQNAHNNVLEALVYDLIWNRSNQHLPRIIHWPEGRMRKAGVKPDARTYALMIKVALATLQGNRRDRTVRRYWDMAHEDGVDLEVASLRDILSDHDLGKLSEIHPMKLDYEVETGHQEEPEVVVPHTIELSATADLVSELAVPQVLETEQKGLGMSSLRNSLAMLNNGQQTDEWTAVRDTDAREEYALRRQMQLEQDALSSAMDRWRSENEKLTRMGVVSLQHGQLGPLMWEWHEKLVPLILAELARIDQSETADKKTPQDKLRCEYGPFLRLVEPHQLAALVTLTVLQTMTKAGLANDHKLVLIVTTVGRALEQEVDAMIAKQNVETKRLEKEGLRPRSSHHEPNLDIQDGLQSSKAQSKFGHKLLSYGRNAPFWTTALHAKVGAILCELFFESAKVPVKTEVKAETDKEADTELENKIRRPKVLVDAFRRQYLFKNGRSTALISPREELAAMLAREPVADVIAKQLPMVAKPRRWTDFRDGAYYKSRTDALRLKHSDKAQRDYAQEAAKRGDLDELFVGLDILGQTGWRINRDVFNVMLKAWNSGEAVANLPPLNKVFPEIAKPAEGASLKEKYEYRHKMSMIHNERMGLHSNRCFQNFQMEIAKSYLDETFYLPHNVDFRGRAYPIPPYLNQMGADNARGLLLFDKGRPLGAQGLRWLKVHLANVYGYDKASLADRAQFATDHLDDIRDSVTNPLTGQRWWLSAEDPWQCLATCQELLKALNSGDPEGYVSHLPIHQDGSCNGLQHYAALGGDIAGARQVNLEPGDKPADVYTGVAELVKAEIKKDSEEGNEMAKFLDGKITRKIVKQTVMTNVYGVTFNGAMKQVKKQLDDYIPELAQQGKAYIAATYIARKIFRGLGALFEGAHEIQYWFGDCANRITSSISPAQLEELESLAASGWKGRNEKMRKNSRFRKQAKIIDESSYRSTVVWTTPLKLPVVQPYRICKPEMVQTQIAKFSLIAPGVADAVDRRKQLQAFPPNFIHSLDATHMMLSAMDAHKQGLTFSAVHDSFWTHAADIDSLNNMLRETFIRMHGEDIIGRLAAEFRARYQGHLYLARVKEGSLAREIRKYRKAFAAECKAQEEPLGPGRSRVRVAAATKQKEAKCMELLREYKRQKLLSSEDPSERRMGKKMVTAASLFEKFDGDMHLNSKDSLGETALGKIPETSESPSSDAIDEALQHEMIAEDQNVDLTSTLEPLMEATEDTSVQSTEEITPRKTKEKGVWLWLPLKFKPIPKKGDWDLQRLRDSTYFFS